MRRVGCLFEDAAESSDVRGAGESVIAGAAAWVVDFAKVG